MHLRFKFELYIKIQHNQINQPNITKIVKIAPNFKIEFEILSQGHGKKFGPQIKIFFLPSAMGGTRQSGLSKIKKNCRVPDASTRQNKF